LEDGYTFPSWEGQAVTFLDGRDGSAGFLPGRNRVSRVAADAFDRGRQDR
jgi:hypothetical protein